MTVIALAGRRIDAPDADPPRFPLRAADAVWAHLRALFEREDAQALVCSAACGADLLALDAAGSLGLRRRVVLPYARVRFRETSVTDRPGDWGPLFDRIIEEVAALGDLVELARPEGDGAYAAASTAVLDEADRLAGPDGRVLAVIVWEGAPRGEGDLTVAFAEAARARGMDVEEVPSWPQHVE